ncbi:glutathione S-transferase family protein [Kushneria indalinina]|uniref:glutathione transferase n=1 Tax=Kushneria indalinina DSM 14324 TaxID=1122140 RepID=A0A3D9DVE5_9GAMM|nr:glutathione S-transferase family protein [Kushneria indalinina]REC94359.1 glutathione S-transferase [Kushneria indalinina DSM 14324]
MNNQIHIFGPQFSTFVRSVQLCCEEKGIPYTVGTRVDGEDIEFKGAQHLDWHPFGKVPVLLHGDRHLIETVSICRYLDAVFDGPALQPDDPWMRAQVDQWAAILSLYIDQTLVRDYLLEFAIPKGEDGTVRMDRVREAEPEVKRTLALLETQLGDREYLVTDRFTLADAIAVPMLDYLFRLPAMGALITETPRLKDYVERLRARRSGSRVLIEAGVAGI